MSGKKGWRPKPAPDAGFMKTLRNAGLFFRKIQSRSVRRPVLSGLTLLLLLYVLNIGRYVLWPSLEDLARHNPAGTALMDYRREQWRSEGKNIDLRWTWVDLRRISPYLRQAVIIAEDSAFWEHHGFDWDAIRLALGTNLERGRLDVGGSTISQQLAKNLYLSPRKSISRKIQEALLTWRLERALEKERILEIYLNVVEWGEGVFGAEAASRRYFGIPAAQLSRRQAATLAAMLPAPLSRAPHSRHVQRVASIILKRMR
jgi:monofunctional biosynthetic peptidoglycan transglycosylase